MNSEVAKVQLEKLAAKLVLHKIIATELATVVIPTTGEMFLEVRLMNGHTAQCTFNDSFEVLLAACLMVHDLPAREK